MDKETVIMISEALANADTKKSYFFDEKELKVIELIGNQSHSTNVHPNLIRIEPMLKDIAELMEDFAMEQDAEDVQERLLKVLQNRDKRIGITNFKRVLHDYPRSLKNWTAIENRWLKERVAEFIEDHNLV